MKKKIVVAVCGGFDPVHVGHLRHFKAAKALGDKLVVMLNSDSWLMKKKGYVFMPYEERKEIIESIRYVDKVVPYIETANGSVSKTLERLQPDIFAKGGDRTIETLPKDELDVCRKLGIRLVTGVGGGKVQSSSWLVNNIATPLLVKKKK
jgi:D-beta-D-heptose 7-phosphate kinase/D-beta-D-heptose 1-phosphate adenosyltransferase